EVFHEGVTLRAALRPGAQGPLQVTITGQGCADAGLCYPPMTKTFVLQADGDGYRAVGDLASDRVPPPRDETAAPDASGMLAGQAGAALAAPGGGSWLEWGDRGMAAWLHQAPMWQILALSLLLGALLSLTPCVLPMVPILLAVISGSGAVGRARGLGLAALYV